MINVSLAAPASLAGVEGAEGGPSRSGDTTATAGQSAFQAVLAPAIAASGLAGAKGVPAQVPASVADGLALGSESDVGRAVHDALAQDDAEAAATAGNDLPLAPTQANLPAVDATAFALRAPTPAIADPATQRAANSQAATVAVESDQPALVLAEGSLSTGYLDRFSSGPHRLPVAGLANAATGVAANSATITSAPFAVGESDGSTPVLPTDLLDAETLDAYLDRFSSGPHRLPATALAAFGAAPLLKYGEGVGRSPVTDLARSAVDVGLSPAQASATASTTGIGTSVPAGFGQTPNSAAWGQALDQQIMLMMNRGAQEARIRLHPQELGQLDIRLSMGGDRVDLTFSVQHASVAGALQQHLPQLTQMLADQGLSLGQASVSHEQAPSGSSAGHSGHSNGDNGAFAMNPDGEIDTSHLLYRPAERGLLDLFA